MDFLFLNTPSCVTVNQFKRSKNHYPVLSFFLFKICTLTLKANYWDFHVIPFMFHQIRAALSRISQFGQFQGQAEAYAGSIIVVDRHILLFFYLQQTKDLVRKKF